AMATSLGLLVALLGCAAAPDPALEAAWEGWKSLHAKEYPGEAESSRREVWEKNLRRIQQHNQEESRGQHTFRLAMNHHGDLVPARAPGTFPGTP
ncbi:CATK protein, partial [Todus mexicanus]|nr:CATK protein [Todus mexicanus]